MVAVVEHEAVTEPSSSCPFDIVAIGASAGGVRALRILLGGLPAQLPVPVVVVLHLAPGHDSVLAAVLAQYTPLTVVPAREGTKLEPGVVYVGVPDRHLLIGDDHAISLSQAALVRFVRPSVDLLFESVAGSYGERAIGVVLTGTGSDGAMGVTSIKERGGTVIVEDEATAEFAAMPHAAAATGAADVLAPLEEIAPVLESLLLGPAR